MKPQISRQTLVFFGVWLICLALLQWFLALGLYAFLGHGGLRQVHRHAVLAAVESQPGPTRRRWQVHCGPCGEPWAACEGARCRVVVAAQTLAPNDHTKAVTFFLVDASKLTFLRTAEFHTKTHPSKQHVVQLQRLSRLFET